MPNFAESSILVAMAISQKQNIRPKTARILAAVFLLLGILLGAFASPHYAVRALQKLKIPTGSVEHMLAKFPYRLGLDIQGGTHLVYQADLSKTDPAEYANAMDSVRDVIERRVNLYGVAEPLVQIERAGENWRLIVELAGIKNINEAIQLIGETPFLEFREERSEAERTFILEAQKSGESLNEDPYFITTGLNGSHVKRATVVFDSTTYQPQISLELTDEGSIIFADLTKRIVGKQLAIYLDGVPISAPTVQEEITGGKAQISGNFTPETAKILAGRLNAGALPVPIRLEAQQSVGATLGQESLARTLHAGFIGFLLVTLFMLLWYRLPGFLAIFALLFYTVIALAIFKMIPVTLSVAGIAGFILSVGMAVDANILIFERMKEELRQGKPLEESIREGFTRAWTSIRDSNVSSLITSAILYWLGTSIVQGFALTLGIGILISMFSAITVTRTLLLAVMTKRVSGATFLFMSGFSK